MRYRPLLPLALLALSGNGQMLSTPQLGKAEAACRPDEPGPAVMIDVVGLKDRKGVIRAELYPPNDKDFLADDNVLLSEGKTFRRVDEPLPASGPISLCMRVPAAGQYTLIVIHDRDTNRKFSAFTDGAGFAGNPKLGLSRPKASQAAFHAGAGITHLQIRLNYWHGLSFSPLKRAK